MKVRMRNVPQNEQRPTIFLYWWITYIFNEYSVVVLVQFTHAVRFDHLVVCSGKDLVDLWGGPLLCGPNPTSQHGQGSDDSLCEPGLLCYISRQLQKCKLYLCKCISGRKLNRYYFSSQARRHMDYVFVLSFLWLSGLDCWFIADFVRKR